MKDWNLVSVSFKPITDEKVLSVPIKVTSRLFQLFGLCTSLYVASKAKKRGFFVPPVGLLPLIEAPIAFQAHLLETNSKISKKNLGLRPIPTLGILM